MDKKIIEYHLCGVSFHDQRSREPIVEEMVDNPSLRKVLPRMCRDGTFPETDGISPTAVNVFRILYQDVDKGGSRHVSPEEFIDGGRKHILVETITTITDFRKGKSKYDRA